MSGWKDWAIGEVVTESDFQSFVQDQVVQVYDDATDRDNTLGTAVAEGMVAYLKDTDSTIVYDGTAWIAVGAGDITGVTAGTALTGGGVSGDVTLDVDISALATAHAGNALNANGELLDVDESAITVAQSQVTDLVSDLADKADNADFTGGTAGYTALSNGTAGLSYQPVSHNYIINGAFDIWQRGDSFTGLTTKEFTADRWFNFASGNTANITKESFTPAELEANGFGDANNYLKLDVTTGDDFAGVGTRIEDARTLAGQDIVFSFWAKGINPSDNQIRVRMRQDFNGSQQVEDIDTFTLTSSWTRYELTATVPSVSGQTINASSYLEISFNQVADTADAWELNLWGVQLEAGSIATPFKRNANSIQGELAACQRYYQRVSENSAFIFTGFYNTTTTMIGDYQYPVTMRRSPDFSHLGNGAIYTGSSVFGATDFDAGFLKTTSARLEATSSAKTLGAAAAFRLNSSGDTFFELDAEL